MERVGGRSDGGRWSVVDGRWLGGRSGRGLVFEVMVLGILVYSRRRTWGDRLMLSSLVLQQLRKYICPDKQFRGTSRGLLGRAGTNKVISGMTSSQQTTVILSDGSGLSTR